MGKTIIDVFDYNKELGLSGWKHYELKNSLINNLHRIGKYFSKNDLSRFRYLIEIENNGCKGKYKDRIKDGLLRKLEPNEITKKSKIKDEMKNKKTFEKLYGFEMSRFEKKQVFIVTRNKTGVILQLSPVGQNSVNTNISEKSLGKKAQQNSLEFQKIEPNKPFSRPYYFLYRNKEPTLETSRSLLSSIEKISDGISLAGSPV